MEKKRSSKSSLSRSKRESKPVKPFITSRASPPPADDFELGATEEAKEYAQVQINELERRRVREENVQRKKDNLRPLRLPPKYKPKRETKAKRYRVRDGQSDSDPDPERIEEEDLEYDGQTILDFNPLPVLAREPLDFIPSEAIEREANPEFNMKTIRRHLGIKTEAESKARPRNIAEVVRKGEWDVKLDPDTSMDMDVKPDLKPDVEPDIKPDIGPDVKPDIRADLKPSIAADIKPDIDADIKPSVAELDEEVYDEGEEEVYDEEDEVVVVPWHNDVPNPVAEEDDEGAEEEVYSEDEFFSSSLPSADTQTQPTSTQTPSIGTSKLLTLSERPPFPSTLEQQRIGPYFLDPEDPTMVVPASINRFLRDYQRAGASFMYGKYRHGVGGILGDDMGLGKTVQVISFLSAIMRKTGTVTDLRRRKNLIRHTGQWLPPQQWATALIVCPTSLIHNWSRELETWGYFEFEVWDSDSHLAVSKSMSGGYLDLILVSNDMLIKWADDLKKLPFSAIIVDEAHRMKQPKGHLARAAKKLNCRACFALTGTLIQNRMEEMWSILDFVRRGWAGTYKQWRQYVVQPILRGHRHDGTIKEVTEAIMRLGEVHQRILPHFYLRRDKRLIAAELPTKRDLVVLCPLGSRQAAVYQKVIDSDDVAFILRGREACDCESGKPRRECCYQQNSVGDDYRTAILKMFDALGRVANHLALLYQHRDDPPRVREVNKRVFEFCIGETFDPSKHNSIEAALDPDNCGKWTLLQNLLKEWLSKPEDGNKILIFSNSVRLLKMISEFIQMSEELAGFDCDIFAGEVSKDERMNMVDRFQDPNSKNPVMLVSTLAGGVGLNLTAANKVVIFDPSWNPANDLQAMDRAFRIGQKRPVDVYRLVGQGTVEELMYERQIYKQQRARQLNDGTFERRTHRGFEGAKHHEDKGELFGVHNIFRFDPRGFVKGNLERVQLAEDRVRTDLVEAEYESGSDNGSDEEGQIVRAQRHAQALRKASRAGGDDGDGQLLKEIMSDGAVQRRTDDNVLEKLGVSSLDHNKAFRDSPEERKIFEIGRKILAQRPDLQSMPANEVGRVRMRDNNHDSDRDRSRKRMRMDVKDEDADQPWAGRFAQGKKRNEGKNLVALEDDDEE